MFVSDLPPPTLPRNQRSSVPAVQVDVARKVQEDPLLRIKLQAEEKKAALLEQMLIKKRLATQSQKKNKEQAVETQVTKKDKKKKKKKKKKKGSESEDSDSGSDADLDAKLAQKLLHLQKGKEEDLDTQIANKLKHIREQKKRSSSSSSSTSSSSDSSESEKDKKSPVSKKRPRSPSSKRPDEVAARRHLTGDRSPRDRHQQRYERNPRDDGRFRNDRRRSRSPHKKEWQKPLHEDRERRDRDRDRVRERTWDRDRERGQDRDRNRDREKRRSPPDQSRPREPSSRPGAPSFQKKPIVPRLSEEEMEKRRREMMQDAVTRDIERKHKVDQYRKETAAEDDQLNSDRPKEAAFVKYVTFLV